MGTKFQPRADTGANWTAANPVLLLNELGYDQTANAFKMGDGATAWNALAYLPGAPNRVNTWTAEQTFDAPIIQTPGQGANNSSPFAQYGDMWTDALLSGGVLGVPSPASLSATLPLGTAAVLGQRVPFPATPFSVAASSTSYLDLSNTGVLAVSTSGTVTANSLRLWEVVSASIVSNAPALAASTAAGTLAAGTYEYQRVAYDATGYGLPSALISITTTATGQVVLTWADEPNEVSSAIYGRISGSIGLLASGVTGTTWTDTGANAVGAAPPTTATSNAIQSVAPIAPAGFNTLLRSYPGSSSPGTVLLAEASLGACTLSNSYADGPFPNYVNMGGSTLITSAVNGGLEQRLFVSFNAEQEVYRTNASGTWTTWVDAKMPLRFQDTSATVNEITIPYQLLGNAHGIYYGQRISIIPAHTNTGSVTINGYPVYSTALTPLQGGELSSDGPIYAYDFINVGGGVPFGWMLLPGGGPAPIQVYKAQASGQAVNLGQAESLFQSSALVVGSTTTAGAITATAPQLAGQYLADGATQTAAFTVTTDTAANILAAMPNAVVGTAFKFRFFNNDQSATGYAATLAGGAGVTIATTLPNPAVPKGGYADYVFTFTSIGASPALTVTPAGQGTI